MKKKKNSYRINRFLIALLIIACAIIPVGCGYKSDTAPATNDIGGIYIRTADESAEYTEGIYEEAGTDTVDKTTSGQVSLETNRKLIKTVSLTVETEEFQELISNVENKVSAFGGYISDAYTYNGSAYAGTEARRHANITLRVPEDKLDSFVTDVSGICNVVQKTTTTEDVTLEYVDTEGKKNMYLAEEKSLLALLEDAKSLDDITFLTNRLFEVRYQIENMESMLRTYDNLVDYATIHLTVEEVKVLTKVVEEEKGFWQNLGDGFMNSLENIAQFLLGAFELLVITLPYLLLVAVVIALFILAIKILIAIIKRKNRKRLQERNVPVVKEENPVMKEPEAEAKEIAEKKE